jgi:hypothetical protein
MNPEALREDLAASNETNRSSPDKTLQRVSSDPLIQAGREVLALALAHPHLTERLLNQGVQTAGLPQPVRLEASDFGDEAQGHLFQILQEHPGKGSDAVLSDERTRPYLDLISVLSLEGSKSVLSTDRRKRGQEIELSEADAKEAWLRLLILSRETAKSFAKDYDDKERLRAEIVVLKAAQHEISTQYIR